MACVQTSHTALCTYQSTILSSHLDRLFVPPRGGSLLFLDLYYSVGHNLQRTHDMQNEGRGSQQTRPRPATRQPGRSPVAVLLLVPSSRDLLGMSLAIRRVCIRAVNSSGRNTSSICMAVHARAMQIALIGFVTAVRHPCTGVVKCSARNTSSHSSV